MHTTIDKAGRVVVPAPIRSKAGLTPGTELDVLLSGNEVHLIPRTPRAQLVRRGKRLVAVPTAAPAELPAVDVAGLIDEERDRWPM